jgi:hypothetical protein
MANFQTYLEDQLPFDQESHNLMAIDTCVENFSGSGGFHSEVSPA